jgi:hypothetical protein
MFIGHHMLSIEGGDEKMKEKRGRKETAALTLRD